MTFKSKVVTTLKVLGIAAATAFMIKMTTPRLYAQEMAEPSRPVATEQAPKPKEQTKLSLSTFLRGTELKNSCPGYGNLVEIGNPGYKYGFGIETGYSSGWRFMPDKTGILRWAASARFMPYQQGYSTVTIYGLDKILSSNGNTANWFDAGRATVLVGKSFLNNILEITFAGVLGRNLAYSWDIGGGAEAGFALGRPKFMIRATGGVENQLGTYILKPYGRFEVDSSYVYGGFYISRQYQPETPGMNYLQESSFEIGLKFDPITQATDGLIEITIATRIQRMNGRYGGVGNPGLSHLTNDGGVTFTFNPPWF